MARSATIDAVTVSRHEVYRADGDRRADLRIAPVVGPATRAVRLSMASEWRTDNTIARDQSL